MFKSLLRSIPTLSGNVKITCSLSDFIKEDEYFDCYVRNARLLPLSSNYYQKNTTCKLLGSSYEYDLKSFYEYYSDLFFTNGLIYDKSDMAMIDKTSSQYQRNTDFEFGVKRVSYQKNNAQYCFYAPIWIDSVDDMPQSFIIEIKFENAYYSTTKKIRVNISRNSSYKGNYLYKYLNKYVSQLDDKVVFLKPDTNQATYWCIDLKHGGFVQATDNIISELYKYQNTMINYDATINYGFKRLYGVIRQVLPLAFLFNPQDLLSIIEQNRYKHCKMTFSGYYVKANGHKGVLNDFSIDYDRFSEDVLMLDEANGQMEWTEGNVANIMDVGFPSLKESTIIDYCFSSKLTPMYNRWKLSLSDDNHPYISNLSWAFSNNQYSNYNYGLYMMKYTQLPSVCKIVRNNKEYYYDMQIPLKSGKQWYNKYDSTIYNNYVNIFNKYCLNWFDVVSSLEGDWWKDVSWSNVVNDESFYNGILYSLTSMYNQQLSDIEKIDKFAVLLYPEFEALNNSEISSLNFSNYVIYNQSTSEYNCNSNLNLLTTEYNNFSGYRNESEMNNALSYISSYHCFPSSDKDLNYLYGREMQTSQYNSMLASGDIFDKSDVSYTYYVTYDSVTYDMNNVRVSYAHYNYNTIGEYISLEDIGIEYSRINKYYRQSDLTSIITNEFIDETKSYTTSVLGYGKDIIEVAYNILNASTYLSNVIGDTCITGYEMIDLPNIKQLTSYNEIYTYKYKVKDGEQDEEERTFSTYAIQVNSNVELCTYHEGLSTYIKDKLLESLYYSTYDVVDKLDTIKYFNTGYAYCQIGTDLTYSTIKEDMSSTYGVSLYVKDKFVKGTYVNQLAKLNLDNEVLHYVNDEYDDTSISEEDSVGYKINKAIHYIGTYIKSKIDEVDDALTHYEYCPVGLGNSDVYATLFFRRYNKNSNDFYGHIIKYENLNNDRDVLWVDYYNFYHLLTRKNLDTGWLDDPKSRWTTYAKFLNKTHVYFFYTEISKDEHCEYKDNWVLDWVNHVFVRTKCLVNLDKGYDIQIKNVFYSMSVFKDMYPSLDINVSFKEFYDKLMYDSSKDLYYIKDHEDVMFELMFEQTFLRVNDIVWSKLAEMEGNSGNYKDLYFYYIENNIEWCTKYKDTIKIWYDYKESILKDKGTITDTNNVLVPLFDDIFAQDKYDTQIYVHYYLKDISVVDIENCKYSYNRNYRYNKNNLGYIIQLSKSELETYSELIPEYVKWYEDDNNVFWYKPTLFELLTGKALVNCLYYKHSSVDLSLVSLYNDLNYVIDKDQNNTNFCTMKRDGVNYGFYLIRLKFDNSSGSFNMTGLEKLEDNKYNKTRGIKSVEYILGNNIFESADWVKSNVKLILPFVNTPITDIIYKITSLVKPSIFNINTKYTSVKSNTANSSQETTLVLSNNYNKNMYMRYMDYITPLITQTSYVSNQYNLKFKNVKNNLIQDGKYRSIGDCVIYPSKVLTSKYHPIHVYTHNDEYNLMSSSKYKVEDYNNVDYLFTPLEYKHYNCSVGRNINTEYSYTYPYTIYEDEIYELESEDKTKEVFTQLINQNKYSKFDEDQILFLYKKFEVSYSVESHGLNATRTQKKYQLKYKFTLL